MTKYIAFMGARKAGVTNLISEINEQIEVALKLGVSDEEIENITIVNKLSPNSIIGEIQSLIDKKKAGVIDA